MTPWASPGLALLAGLGIALTAGDPWPAATRTIVRPLLQTSVVLLGFGTNLGTVLVAARQGFAVAAATIVLTFLLGALLRRLLDVPPSTATLLSAGTAICGGSAIAAVGAATAAAEVDMAVALGTVFLLNAAALFAFPPLGHLLGLSQAQFGLWAGIAIHDVSSVVAAASSYGREALQTATAVKLSRTLWIAPVALGARYAARRARAGRSTADAGAATAPIAIPWFIGLFVLASLAGTVIPLVHEAAPALVAAARVGMTVTLLLVGLTLSRASLKAVGIRPVIMGVGLWLAISAMALAAVRWVGV